MTVTGSLFVGYRPLTTMYPGSRCEVCGGTIRKGTTAYYSPSTRTLRHWHCHHEHPQNQLEVWEAIVTAEDPFTGETTTERRVIRITTLRREVNLPEGVQLIRHLDNIDPQTTLNELRARYGHIAPVRGNYT